MSVDYELSESRKRYKKNLAAFEGLNEEKDCNEEESYDPQLKLENNAELASNFSNPTTRPKKSKPSKSSKKSKSKLPLPRKMPPNDDYGAHSLNAYTSLDNTCLTQTAPFALIPRHNLQVNANLIDAGEIVTSDIITSDPQKHHKAQREDASNLAYPINPFDHLMPHRDDYGTPNMAWIGDDGLVHTPCGGVYAKTTEAVANFRRELKYDSGWHRVRQRCICLVLLIIFLTICAVVVLLIARSMDIVDVELINQHHLWTMDKSCVLNESISQGCYVNLASLFNVRIDNHNWVPATVNSMTVEHKFFCTSNLDCPSGGTQFGTRMTYMDGRTEVPRTEKGNAKVNDTKRFKLGGCTLSPPNGTFCEWQQSCKLRHNGADPPGHFILELRVTAELSCALQSGTEVYTVVRLGTFCNGTAIVCEVDADVKSKEAVCY